MTPPVGSGRCASRSPSGRSVWRTSLFPSAEAGAYVLPVKKAVRVAEGLDDDDLAEVTIRLVAR